MKYLYVLYSGTGCMKKTPNEITLAHILERIYILPGDVNFD